SCVPPAWAKRVMVAGGAAYGSQAHRQMVYKRDADAPARRWGFVFANARTWKTVEDKPIKDFLPPRPRQYHQPIRRPRRQGTTVCKPCWVGSARLGLPPISDVTVVLRKKGRNAGPKHTKILGTHRDEWLPRQVVWAHQRRWPGEHLKRALKTDLG